MIFPFGQRLDWKHLFGRTWKLLYSDGSGDPQELALGAADTALVSGGPTSAPSFVGVAPTTADYLVGTANAGLSAEIVVGTTPGGELGGTWASPTVDATHSGSAHHAESHASRHQDGGADELDLYNLDLVVGTATAVLPSEIVIGVTPGGELGCTWASPTVDATHSGSVHPAIKESHIPLAELSVEVVF